MKYAEVLKASHFVNGDYVITGIRNAFDHKFSFWISKKGYTISLYCFSTTSEKDAMAHLKEFHTYARMFDGYIKTHKNLGDLREEEATETAIRGEDSQALGEFW